MPDRHSDAEKSAGAGAGTGYGLPNKAAPMPRQWQMPTPTPAPMPRSTAGMQHFYPGPKGAGNWRQAAPPRRMERAILVGLWLLVMLTAVAIGMRMLDLSAMTAPPAPAPARPLASDAAANAMRSAAFAAASPRDSDPFDDDAPGLPAITAPLPEPLPKPLPEPRPAARLSAAATLSPARPAAAAPAGADVQAGSNAACPDALRAMQLCPGMK